MLITALVSILMRTLSGSAFAAAFARFTFAKIASVHSVFLVHPVSVYLLS